jgi:aminoglycoside/choline kinase family phosphotransferase
MGSNDPLDQHDCPEALDTAFARAVTACFGANTTLAGTTPLTGDASSRQYFRLALSGNPSAPPTVVAMVLGSDRLPLSSEELTVFATPLTEIPYVNVSRFLARIGVRIPELYHHDPSECILLLEDIGDQTLRAAVVNAPEVDILNYFRKAIDQLVHIQIVGTRHADATCIAFQQRFDRRLFNWEFHHFLQYGLPSHIHAEPAELNAAFAPVVERLATAPAVLAHRDFQAWNLHVHEGAICVIDFQDALLAPATYDLASLLTDRDIATVITPSREDILIAYYVDARRRVGASDEVPMLRREYFLCVLQRALKVIGRFHYLARVKGKPGYLRYLPHVVSQARRALEATRPETENLRQALTPLLDTACEP